MNLQGITEKIMITIGLLSLNNQVEVKLNSKFYYLYFYFQNIEI